MHLNSITIAGTNMMGGGNGARTDDKVGGFKEVEAICVPVGCTTPFVIVARTRAMLTVTEPLIQVPPVLQHNTKETDVIPKFTDKPSFGHVMATAITVVPAV